MVTLHLLAVVHVSDLQKKSAGIDIAHGTRDVQGVHHQTGIRGAIVGLLEGAPGLFYDTLVFDEIRLRSISRVFRGVPSSEVIHAFIYPMS